MARRVIKKEIISKEEYAEILHEKLIRKCRIDPKQFIQYVLSWGIPGWIKLGQLHMKWQDAITYGGTRILVVTPRDHAKTTLIPIGRVLWEIGKNPDLRIKLVCQSDDIAIKRLSAIMDHIERNPRMVEVFPDLIPSEKGEWSKTKIYVKRKLISPDPSIEAIGILSTGTGGRADLLVFDDPIDFRNAIQQPALKQVVKDAYRNVWVNVLEETGKLIYVATPWTKDDLTSELLQDKSFTKIVDKIDENFTPIWEEKWNKERLIERFNELGNRAFSRAFRMEALSDEEALFTEQSIIRCEHKEIQYGDLPLGVLRKDITMFIGVDVGSGRSETGAYTVIFTGAVLSDMKKIPINITRGRFKSPEFARIFYDLTQQFNPEFILVENNAAQEAIIQWVQEVYGVNYMPPIQGYFTGSQKMSEEVGLPAMSVEFEQRNWILPEFHMEGCNCGYCVWIQELKEFPLGKYSDTVMASWLFRESIRKYMGKEPKITVLTAENTSSKRAEIGGIGALTRRLELEEDEDGYQSLIW